MDKLALWRDYWSHHELQSQKGNSLGIATLDDRSGRLDLTLFGESLEQFGEKLQKIPLLLLLDK